MKTRGLPCVVGNTQGLKIFQSTADQRFLMGEKTFLRTHFPARMWVNQARSASSWGEEDLLHALVNRSDEVVGNRLFLLFGAAGSGKSELMRWLMVNLDKYAPERKCFTVRISRGDIDPIRTVVRILETFNMPNLDTGVLQRWDDLKRKPVTLANQIVWQALSVLYPTDDDILPLSFRLRPIVEGNLLAAFPASGEASQDEPLKYLITPEQLERAMADSPLHTKPAFEQLHAQMQESLESAVLGDARFVSSLRQISHTVMGRYSVRPLMVVDDLVQSMNVYSTDLLDYFLTLEEGQWDAIIGVTPAAFEWDQRGRQLLTRIRQLDTVDDRVVKLDLSDTTGDSSSFLNRDNAVEYVLPYIENYKQLGGFRCDSACPCYATCIDLQWGVRDDASLAPLNPALVERMWSKIPAGKGRARYLLLAVRDLLEGMSEGRPQIAVERLVRHVATDLYVDHPDPVTRAVVAAYCPGNGGDSSVLTEVPIGITRSWGIEECGDISVRSLKDMPGRSGFAMTVVELSTPAVTDSEIAPAREAVHNWLEAKPVNPELLKPFRHGVSRFTKEFVDPSLLAGHGHARCSGVLRWLSTSDGVSVPLSIEGIDSTDGVLVRRSLGATAFDLLAYSTATGKRRRRIVEDVLNSEEACSLPGRAEALRERRKKQLAEVLGYAAEELAFHLFRVVSATGGYALTEALPVFEDEASPAVPEIPWQPDLVRTIRAFWDDCFKLRDHVYDGHRISDCLERSPTVLDSYRAIMSVKADAIPSALRLGNRRLSDQLMLTTEHLHTICAWLQKQLNCRAERRACVEAARLLLDRRCRRSIRRLYDQLAEAGSERLLLMAPPALPSGWESGTPTELLTRLAHAEYAGTIADYRSHGLWNESIQNTWFLSVVRWYKDMRSVHEQCSHFHRTVLGIGMDVQAQTRAWGIREILSDSARLIAEADHMAGAHSGARLARQSPEAPYRLYWTTIATALMAMLPEGFEVRTAFAQTAAIAHMICEGLRGSSGDMGLLEQSAVLSLHRDLFLVCDWWRAYIAQIPLLRLKGRRVDTRGASRFLAQLYTCCRISKSDLDSWNRFIRYATKRCTRDLPVFEVMRSQGLPLSMLADRLFSSGERTTAGVELSAREWEQLVAQLRKAPGLAAAIRLTMPGGDV